MYTYIKPPLLPLPAPLEPLDKSEGEWTVSGESLAEA